MPVAAVPVVRGRTALVACAALAVLASNAAAAPAAPAPPAAAPAPSAPSATPPTAHPSTTAHAVAARATLAPFTDRVPGTAIELQLLPVPGCDGVPPFFMARTEIPWELFDAFIYQLDKKSGASTAETDAVTRPTKPYVSVDRGFGHQGWPAISMSAKGAVQFCEWLTKKTGRNYRLPTLQEWRCAATLGKVTAETMTRHAWTDADANVATHKLATKDPDALGIHDLWGNAAEWCSTPEGGFAVIGGSYRDERIDPAQMAPSPDTPDWNESDPQFPKSIWWLVDGPFIGMRVVTSDALPTAPGAPTAPTAPGAPATPAAPPAPAPAPPAPTAPTTPTPSPAPTAPHLQ